MSHKPTELNTRKKRCIIYVDESGGPGEEPLLMCAIAAISPKGKSYLSLFRPLLESLQRQFKLKGELRYSGLGRYRKEVARYIEEKLKESGARIGTSEPVFQEEVAKLGGWAKARINAALDAVKKCLKSVDLSEIGVILVVVDNMPYQRYIAKALKDYLKSFKDGPKVVIKFRPSHKVPGIQLADVLAGFNRNLILKKETKKK